LVYGTADVEIPDFRKEKKNWNWFVLETTTQYSPETPSTHDI
jgi:hypothetical protein